MVNVDRNLRTPTRTRFHSLTAGIVLLFLGVSAPVVATAAVPAIQESGVVRILSGATETPKTEAPNTLAPKAAAKPAPKPVAKPVAKKATAKKVTAPSMKQMHPRGIPGGQKSFTPTKAQLKNAKAIVDAGKKMGLPPRAWVIAVATSMQESHLNNYGNLGANNDHDSLGLFQQRPSSGWGTPKQIHNPTYSATAFYKGLRSVSNWNKMPLTRAAQSVQVSAFPNHYAKWEKHAGNVVLAVHGSGPYAKLAAGLK